ncbi:MAG: class I SAM-dependent methyltransferase [Candidatus Thorarchaeota archaeon]|nr:class I SAM-dependent methyltransferase [Candidatus Thorarchaeota archaeon]
MSKKRNEDAWDKLTEHYQGSRRISLENYHYGAYAPGENELGIIGDVDGLDILEIGCGGGQNSIVLKKQGARRVIGLDQSENQLKHARYLAERVGTEVQFIKCDMEDLTIFGNTSFDLIVSSHAMNYAFDLDRVLRECNRVLKPRGRIVTCISHPLWIVLGDVLENDDFSRLVNYFDGFDDIWDWEGYEQQKIATFHGFHRYIFPLNASS